MSKDAMLPCIVCGTVLANCLDDGDNQPSEGTEFRTYGHYGSTFWDSLRRRGAGRQHLRRVPAHLVRAAGPAQAVTQARGRRHPRLVRHQTAVGRQWVDREMVPYFDGPEDEDADRASSPRRSVLLDQEGHGHYQRIEWVHGWEQLKVHILSADAGEDLTA